MACSSVGIALIMGWVSLFQLRFQEIEKPYYRLWLNTIDGFLQFTVMTSIFVRDLFQNDKRRKIARRRLRIPACPTDSHTLFSLGVLREGKQLPRKRRWSKLSNLVITITMGVYLLNLEDYQQICMVILHPADCSPPPSHTPTGTTATPHTASRFRLQASSP